MPLNHFKAKHFGSKSMSLLGHLGAAVVTAINWILRARRRMRR